MLQVFDYDVVDTVSIFMDIIVGECWDFLTTANFTKTWQNMLNE